MPYPERHIYMHPSRVKQIALEEAFIAAVRTALSCIFYDDDIRMETVHTTAFYKVPYICPCMYCADPSQKPEPLHCGLELSRRIPWLDGEPVYTIYVHYAGAVFCEVWDGEPETTASKVAFVVGVLAYHAGLLRGGG